MQIQQERLPILQLSIQYTILTVMKPSVPAANIVIATLYLLIIIAIGYITKLVFRTSLQQGKAAKAGKYTKENMSKGISSTTMQKHVPIWKILIQSYFLKYTAIGTFMNANKCYLFKDVFIVSVIFVSCTAINHVIIWPLAIAATIFSLSFVAMSIFNLPFNWKTNIKVDEQKKAAQRNQIGSEGHQIEPGIIMVNQQRSENTQNCQKVKKQNSDQVYFSPKYIVCVGVFCFSTLVMATQTMMTVYNSISNLGALNIGSVASVIALDQFILRPVFGAVLLLTAKIILLKLESQRQGLTTQSLASQVKNGSDLSLFQFNLFGNLCQQTLLLKMNQIYELHGQQSNYEMGASPTKKKTMSPSKVPKANHQGAQSETLMNLDITKRLQGELPKHEEINDNHLKNRSPIRQIQMAALRQSVYLTSAEKQLFGQQVENNRFECNKSVDIQNIQKIKVNPNQYFSVQRLPKDQLHNQDHIQDDGLVLVEAGLNLVKEKQGKMKPNTIDIDFSPTKKRKKTTGGYHPKRRQLIITGSSPYLQYLPDMMKKQKNKKNLTPSSQYQNGVISRKVL